MASLSLGCRISFLVRSSVVVFCLCVLLFWVDDCSSFSCNFDFFFFEK